MYAALMSLHLEYREYFGSLTTRRLWRCLAHEEKSEDAGKGLEMRRGAAEGARVACFGDEEAKGGLTAPAATERRPWLGIMHLFPQVVRDGM